MTGYYVRVVRDGRWQTLEIEMLTDEELDRIREAEPDSGWQWVRALCEWIREHVREESPP